MIVHSAYKLSWQGIEPAIRGIKKRNAKEPNPRTSEPQCLGQPDLPPEFMLDNLSKNCLTWPQKHTRHEKNMIGMNTTNAIQMLRSPCPNCLKFIPKSDAVKDNGRNKTAR